MFTIKTKSQYGNEEIDTAETLKEAEYLVAEYALAFGKDFTVYYEKDGQDSYPLFI
jgi:hypothetical protein